MALSRATCSEHNACIPDLLLGLDASMKGKMVESLDTAGRNALQIPACNCINKLKKIFRFCSEIKQIPNRDVYVPVTYCKSIICSIQYKDPVE